MKRAGAGGSPAAPGNIDPRTVEGFGDEWRRFDQSTLAADEIRALFERYFRIFPWDRLSEDAVGADIGCGSGRWARLAAPRVGGLYCVDASPQALRVCRKNLSGLDNCRIVQASVGALPFADGSLDFAYCLGVLHHVPDTAGGLSHCATKLKAGAPFLVYLYYAMDNRSLWFRCLWRASDLVRRVVARLPHPLRYAVSQAIAALVYLPLARLALALEKAGAPVGSMPLSAYRRSSFYTMRTDALDRFGTRLERRFTKDQIRRMMEAAGLERITFSDRTPFWCAVGFKGEQA